MTVALSKEKWISHGLTVLAKQGHGALKADTLARSLKVTRGSFYWHFKDISDYHAAVIELWRQETTEGVIARTNAFADSSMRLPTLFRAALASSNTALEKAMLAWALSDQNARRAVAEVEAIRVHYVEQLLRAANVPASSIESRAQIIHWTFIGFSNLHGKIPDDSTAIIEELITFSLSKTKDKREV